MNHADDLPLFNPFEKELINLLHRIAVALESMDSDNGFMGEISQNTFRIGDLLNEKL